MSNKGEENTSNTSPVNRSNSKKIPFKYASTGAVSQKFKTLVSRFILSIPGPIQHLMAENDIRLSLYAHEKQIPGKILEEHSIIHLVNEPIEHLPYLYEPFSKTLIAIELKEFPISAIDAIIKNGWHELGHAIDHGVLKNFSHKKAFDDEFNKGLSLLTEEDKIAGGIFVKPDPSLPFKQQYSTAKKELFAELFALHHSKPINPTRRERMLLINFEVVINLMEEQEAGFMNR